VPLCIVLMFSACASVPLGTMLRFSTFDEEDFAAIDPQQLSVRIFLADPQAIGEGPVFLNLLLETSGQPFIGNYQMAPSRSFRDEQSSGWFGPAVTGTTYQFELTPAQVLEFRRLQQEMLNTAVEHMTISVNFPPLTTDPEEARVWVFLALDDKRDYITLVDGARVQIDYDQE